MAYVQVKLFSFSSRWLRIIVVCAWVLCGFAAVCAQEPAKTKPSVLALYWYSKDFPGNVLFEDAFKQTLNITPNGPIDYYAEYLEEDRFPGKDQAQLLHNHLLQKYANRRIDVVLAVSDPPLRFLMEHRKDLFPQSPIVFVSIKPPAREILTAAPGLTGIIPVSTHKQTVDLALNLHPDTERLFFVSGTPERDKRLETIARTELAPYEKDLQIEYLTDLPMEELIAKTRRLPPHSIILYAWQQARDPQGQFIETWDFLSAFAPTASAPIYGMGSANIGRGLVGGYVSGSEENGHRLAEMVQQIFNGKNIRDIPVENAPAEPMFDWRQLRRWNIDERSLPAGAVVRFRELSFWELYKWRIVGVLSLLLVQTGFIAVLLVERRRRLLANQSLDRLNAELETRIEARTEALNTKSRELESFAYSVAHDLKAPLRGIDGYSRLLLQQYAAGLDDHGRAFLRTIQQSTDEMNQLIDDLLTYSRLERRELKSDRIELAPIINSLVEEKKREELVRPIDFVVNVNGAFVVADANGLAQALRNYLDNAVKFSGKVSAPRIEIGVRELAERCVVWVKDNGIGFDMKDHNRIFVMFQRLNLNEEYPGTGIGLAIVRKAMERMGGKAWAESTPGHGATFYLELPK